MSDVVIWHNPRCSKSRATLALLEERGVTPRIVRYLDEPPTADELRTVLAKLDARPRALVRDKESIYRELGLADADDEALIAALAAHPKLIERPVVIRGDRAVVGRPPENVLELL